ncbi:MAG: DNA repair exonuclease [Planctomycetota bacterium]
MAEGDQVVLKLVHTADWHLGLRFPSFAEEDRPQLSRARLAAVERLLELARRMAADGVLCAGDLFDEPDPAAEWWEGLLAALTTHGRAEIPVFLLPGNHDPLVPGSVWQPTHPFRRQLPDFAHVVDRDDFEWAFGEEAVLYAAPCRSQAGQRDLALSLPARAPGDDRVRIGMVHGSTVDIKGFANNFPIARDAVAQRGLDYLAIGDTHGFREVPPGARPPTVYPGTPEPTGFGETDAGHVALVFFSRDRRVTLRKERVATWRWAERTVTDLAGLRAVRDAEDLTRTVLRLTLDLALPPAEFDEAERILRELRGTEAAHGRVGVLQVQRRELVLDTSGVEQAFADLPGVLQEVARRLRTVEADASEEGGVAREALSHLYRLTRELR